MKSPRKLILTVSMSVALLAGSVVAGAPAQAAGPIYWGGGQAMYSGPCLAQQQQIASNRAYRIVRSCYFGTPFGGTPAYWFSYTPAY